MMRLRHRLSLLCLLAAPLGVANAQSPARKVELGIDAALVRQTVEFRSGFGPALSESFTSLLLPAQQVRIGFFVNEKTSIEPTLGVQRFSSRNGSTTRYSLTLGVLYHFSSDPAKAGVYVRPLLGITGQSDEEDSESATAFGAGVGVKMPLADRLAFRGEVNYARQGSSGITSTTNTLGLTVGMSFFTR